MTVSADHYHGEREYPLAVLQGIGRAINDKGGCPDCRGPLGFVEMYPHPGGIWVEGMTGKQWVYFKCTRCGYDWALWKLVRRLV